MGVLSSLGPVLRELREARGVLLVEVAARLKRSESAMSKFERAETVPRNLDEVVQAYADELGISPAEPWKLAAERANHTLLPLEEDDPAGETNPGENAGSESAGPKPRAATEGTN